MQFLIKNHLIKEIPEFASTKIQLVRGRRHQISFWPLGDGHNKIEDDKELKHSQTNLK